jgi:RNA polymerase primary sigma factor
MPLAQKQAPIPPVEGLEERFVRAVLEVVIQNEGENKRAISRLLSARGRNTDPSTVNRALYALEKSGHLVKSRDTPPNWLVGNTVERLAVLRLVNQLRIRSSAKANRPGLWSWQTDALAAWRRARRRGVIQAVTGTGKTRVGLEAAASELTTGGQVLILVPTRALLEQWHRQLVDWFGREVVGRLGNGHHKTFRTHALLVATPHSARNGTHFRGVGLLIADECHRYGSDGWAKALDEKFERRIGLTATYERHDQGDELLAAYFGDPPVFDIGYRRAIDEGVVSPFRLAFVGVDLGDAEMIAYRAFDEACSAAFGRLVNVHGLPSAPFGHFMREVVKAADGIHGGKAQRAAWKYQSNFSKRRALLADTKKKLNKLEDLDAAVRSAHGTLVFTQTKHAALRAAELLGDMGHRSAAIYGDLDGKTREYLLKAFRQGDRTVLTAPRVLDEGIDVPDADLGIVVSASNGRRQMIQRMGRVLRQKKDGRRARLVILFAVGTSEDPERGAHEGFIHLACDVAEATATFAPSATAAAICQFLATGRRASV